MRIKSTGQVYPVTEVTTDYGPDLPCGVLLVLDKTRVYHLTGDIEKVCKHCHTTVMEFTHVPGVQDG